MRVYSTRLATVGALALAATMSATLAPSSARAASGSPPAGSPAGPVLPAGSPHYLVVGGTGQPLPIGTQAVSSQPFGCVATLMAWSNVTDPTFGYVIAWFYEWRDNCSHNLHTELVINQFTYHNPTNLQPCQQDWNFGGFQDCYMPVYAWSANSPGVATCYNGKTYRSEGTMYDINILHQNAVGWVTWTASGC